jgi:hypothetical protein
MRLYDAEAESTPSISKKVKKEGELQINTKCN